MGSIERFQGPTEIAADKGNLGGDAAGASDRFSRAKGGGPQQQPRSAEIAKLGHGNAAQRHCRRVIAQRDTVQRAEGITRARSRAPALIGESHFESRHTCHSQSGLGGQYIYLTINTEIITGNSAVTSRATKGEPS